MNKRVQPVETDYIERADSMRAQSAAAVCQRLESQHAAFEETSRVAARILARLASQGREIGLGVQGLVGGEQIKKDVWAVRCVGKLPFDLDGGKAFVSIARQSQTAPGPNRETEALEKAAENPLEDGEADELARCEQVIEAGMAKFVEVGMAMAEIREKRLYRSQYGTFAEYCDKKWGFSYRRGHQLMAGAEIAKALNVNPGSHLPAPRSEAQVRALGKLPELERPLAWAECIRRARNGQPSRELVEEVVAEFQAEAAMPLAEALQYLPSLMQAAGLLELPRRSKAQAAARVDLLEKFLWHFTMLKQVYVKVEDESPIKDRSETEIANFLADTAWVELERKAATEELQRRKKPAGK